MATQTDDELPPGYTVKYRTPETPTTPSWWAYDTDGLQAGAAGTRDGAVEVAWIYYERHKKKP